MCKCGKPSFPGLKLCMECLTKETEWLDRCYEDAGPIMMRRTEEEDAGLDHRGRP
jgi:hypothetical protein